MRCDTIWTNAQLATMAGDDMGVVHDGVVAARDGIIAYAGPAAEARDLTAPRVVDCGGRWITPGLIDAHTHIVHAGNRSDEFEARLAGKSYAQIAREGGGIMASVRATRAADVDTLIAETLPRLDTLLREGVTSIEIKSGYGLTLEAERTMLRAARRLGGLRRVRVVTTFLGAHALPPEWHGNADGYVAELADHWLPALAAEGLVDAVDAFCEGIAFSRSQVDRLFTAARALGLPVKLHAEQLSNLDGAALAAGHGALSADHLEHLDEAGIAAMAQAGTVAMLLPGAFYAMRDTLAPPIGGLRAAGVPIALATDCNPGTSPLTSLLLALNMGATLFRLTVNECLRGATVNAARALGLAGQVGQLVPGQAADLAIWSIARPADLVYRMGANPLHARIRSGS